MTAQQKGNIGEDRGGIREDKGRAISDFGDCFVAPSALLAMTTEWIPAFAGMTHSLSRICHAHKNSHQFTLGRATLRHTPPSSPPKFDVDTLVARVKLWLLLFVWANFGGDAGDRSQFCADE